MMHDEFIQLEDILESSRFLLSDIKPSEWTEKNRYMTSEVSPFPGRFSYDRTPYFRKIVNHVQRTDPSKEIAFMKGAQIGASTNIIESAIGYIISEDPCAMLYFTGHIELTKRSMTGKIDQMIDSCGLRKFIRPNALRKKNQRTGDTNLSKEFAGGNLYGGSADNHGTIKQISVRVGFNDDIEQAKSESAEDGDTVDLIRQRYAAYADQRKIYWISTPKTVQGSIINKLFLSGDQQRWHIPCPCCGVMIPLFWEVPMKDGSKDKGGIIYKLDDKNRLITGSVAYKCQECGDHFTDQGKSEWLGFGEWIPTAIATNPDMVSYHLSALYATAGMFDWEYYAKQYLEACPPGEAVNESKLQTFTNLCLGEPYESKGEAPKANDLQRNQIDYEMNMIPEKVSEQHGNGKIACITLACDLNGKKDDARLDYEIVAWSESGSSYSIMHGSIGTFVPRENALKFKEDRERWTYEFNKPNSVWPEFTKLITSKYPTDTGRNMKVVISGLDCGYHTDFAYKYIDSTIGIGLIVGLKGKDKEKYIRFNQDIPNFKPAVERSKLYLVVVGRIKDQIAEAIKLRYNPKADEKQPPGFMNFPYSGNGKYMYEGYFSHWESEHRVTEAKTGEGISSMWVKKSASSVNHFFDVRVYNVALKEIITSLVCKEAKIKNFSWNDYVDIALGRYKK